MSKSPSKTASKSDSPFSRKYWRPPSINRRVTVNFRSPMFYVKSVDNGYRTTIIFWITGGPISTRSSATCRSCLLFEVLQVSIFGLQGIFVRDRIIFVRDWFRYYYYSVRRQSFSLLFSFRSANYNHFRYRYRERRPFIIVLVIIIVNENITASK